MWNDLESQFSNAPVKQMMTIAEDSMFLSRLQETLSPRTGHIPRKGMTKLLDHLYIGGHSDAEDLISLQSHGITHIFNLAAIKSRASPYAGKVILKNYKEVNADDNTEYNIMQHFDEVKAFVDQAKKGGGKALVHCMMGINRSGAICVAYVMVDQKWDLLKAATHVKRQRGIVVTNTGFQKQLVEFAREKNLLFPKG